MQWSALSVASGVDQELVQTLLRALTSKVGEVLSRGGNVEIKFGELGYVSELQLLLLLLLVVVVVVVVLLLLLLLTSPPSSPPGTSPRPTATCSSSSPPRASGSTG